MPPGARSLPPSGETRAHGVQSCSWFSPPLAKWDSTCEPAGLHQFSTHPLHNQSLPETPEHLGCLTFWTGLGYAGVMNERKLGLRAALELVGPNQERVCGPLYPPQRPPESFPLSPKEALGSEPPERHPFTTQFRTGSYA